MLVARPRLLSVAGLVVLALVLVAAAASSAAGAPGAVLRQRQGATYMTVTVSSAGTATTLASRARIVGANGKARAGPIRPYDGSRMRYRDGRLFTLNYAPRTFSTELLKRALAAQEAEDAIVAKAVPRFEEASKNDRVGLARVTGRPTKPIRVPASFGGTSRSSTIAGVGAEGHILRIGGVTERVWIATSLPLPPPGIISAVRAASARATANPASRAMRAVAGRVVLRVEVRSGKRWRRALDTLSVKRTQIPDGAFDAPARWRETAAASPVPVRRTLASAASVPASVSFGVGPGVPDLNPATPTGPGPISAHPEPYLFYWGHDFATHPQFRDVMDRSVLQMLRPAFMDGLSQYGVKNGRLTGSTIIDSNPPQSVGSWNTLALVAFVLSHRYGYDAPKIWLSVGGHDPLIVIFVAASAVDHSLWGGYHFFAATEAVLIPFPFNFLVHDAMPWLVVKVDDSALTTGPQDQFYRRQCHADGPPAPPGVCHNLGDIGASPANPGMDHTTALASHELAETATDPYPFTGWTDPTMQPVWTKGEINDICEEGSIAPFGTYAISIDTVVGSYWSNRDHACVPEMRPTISITYPPSDGSAVTWHRVFKPGASVTDPIDGNNDPVKWAFDGGASFSDPTLVELMGEHLALGPHTITGTVVDSQGVTASATRTFVVVATPPSVTITTPANGTTYGDDETRPYRASVVDAQDGALPASQVQWWLDGTTTGTLMGTGTQITYRIPVNGAHTVTVRAVNSAGLATERTISVTIGPPSGNPSVTITAPPEDAHFNGSTFHLTASANSPIDGPLAGSTIKWSTDADPLWHPTGSDVTFDTPFSCEAVTNHFTATATDSAAHTGSDTITLFLGTIC